MSVRSLHSTHPALRLVFALLIVVAIAGPACLMAGLSAFAAPAPAAHGGHASDCGDSQPGEPTKACPHENPFEGTSASTFPALFDAVPATVPGSVADISRIAWRALECRPADVLLLSGSAPLRL